jgi:hypothetical protein
MLLQIPDCAAVFCDDDDDDDYGAVQSRCAVASRPAAVPAHTVSHFNSKRYSFPKR